MTDIIRATIKDAELLSKIGKTAFFESHGHSASAEDVNNYIDSNFSKEALENDLKDSSKIYYIIYQNKIPAGYSKIVFNVPHPNIDLKNVAKLERIYLLNEFHGLKLGLELFEFNLHESMKQKQSGMWLFVWKENLKAINFYQKKGFEIIGSHDFKISATHSNPNHQMLLTF